MDQTNKQKQFIQNRDLKFYIRHGISVINIHIVYQFKQSLWLAKYNKYTTEQRSKAKKKNSKSFLSSVY